MPIDRRMVVEFGTGDVIVSVARWGDGPIDTIAFKESSEEHPVGDSVAPDPEEGDFDVFLRFTDPASVDVVMQALQMVKDNLKEDAEG